MIYKRFIHHTFRVNGASIKPGSLDETMLQCKKEGIEHFTLVAWPSGSSLDFLKNQDFIKSINISLDGNIDISPINTLQNLEYFESDNNRVVGMIDFSCFPKLKYLQFGYSDYVFSNFKSLKHLKKLIVNNWPFEDLKDLTHLLEIEELELDFAKKLKNLSGIQELHKLDFLSIYSANKLEDINELSNNYKTLRRLSFDLAKRIQDFHVLESLINLERFNIDRCSPLHSIQWMKKLEKLQWAYIGVEVLDGDIQYLKDRKIEYKKMRKYSTGQS